MRNRNIGGTNYAYSFDANGNLLSGGANSDMKWDAQNRMVGCTLAGNPNIVSTYTYGADDLRRSMTVGTVTTNYILDGQSVVRETTTDGKTRTYLNGPRGSEFCLETTSTGSKLWYYVYDGHGNVVGEADATGKIVDSTGTEKTFRNYDVWGAVRNSTEAGQSLSKNKYCGSLGHTSEPDTGLIYMRARYYDPGIGRFISEDSAKDGGNWYAYAGNNPVGMVDADGRTPEDEQAQRMAEFLRDMARAYNFIGNAVVATGLADLRRGRALQSIGLEAESPAAVAAGVFIEAIGGKEVRGGAGLKIAAVLMGWASNYAEGMQGDFLDYANDFFDSILSVL